MKFVDPKNDIAFKKIFGDSNKTEILISFLNAVLELPSPIASLTIASPYQVPRIEDLKDTSLDVKAVDETGREFIVEMQVEGNELFGKRALYYLAKSYVGQIRKAEQYKELKPAYFVGILDFNMFEGDDYITRHILINQESGRHDLKDFEFNFIELKKYNKTENELHSVVDKWIFFLKNAENLQIIPAAITEPEIKEAFESANQMKWTEEELNVYDYWSGKEGDKAAQIITAENKGKKEGLAEGLQKGKEEGLAEGLQKGKEEGLAEGVQKGKKEQAIDIARNGLKQGLDSGTIAAITGLTIAEIENLKQNNE